MHEANNPANATEIIGQNELDHLRAVNVELLEALEEALLDAGGFGTPGGWIDDAKRAILRAKG